MKSHTTVNHRLDNVARLGFYETAVNPENGLYVLTIHELMSEDGSTTHVDAQVTQQNAIQLAKTILERLASTVKEEGIVPKEYESLRLMFDGLDEACHSVNVRSN